VKGGRNIEGIYVGACIIRSKKIPCIEKLFGKGESWANSTGLTGGEGKRRGVDVLIRGDERGREKKISRGTTSNNPKR